jgi:hypothetical protein
MAESGVIKTVVVKNGISYNVSVQRASLAPASNVVPVTSSPAVATAAAPTNIAPTAAANVAAANVAPIAARTAAAAAAAVNAAANAAAANVAAPNVSAAPAAAAPAFVAPIVAFMNHIQQNYSQSDMKEDAIDNEISELQVKDGRRLVNADPTLLRDKNLQKKVQSGRATFAEFIKKIIANEQGRVNNFVENALRQYRLQKNTRPAFFKEKELAAKQKEYDDEFAKEIDQQAKYREANRKLGDYKKNYEEEHGKRHRDIEEKMRKTLELIENKNQEIKKIEKLLTNGNNSTIPAWHDNPNFKEEQEKRLQEENKKLEELTNLERTLDAEKNNIPTEKNYKAEQTRLVYEENDKLNKQAKISRQKSQEINKIQDELRELQSENTKEENEVKKSTITAHIRQMIGKVIPLVTTRLNAMNEIEKAVKGGLADYLVNRTIDETERYEGTIEQNTTRQFIPILTKIKNDNEDLPNSIIDRMVKAAEKVHYSKSPSLAPYTFNLDDAPAKVNIKQEFYKMEPPKWGLFRGGRHTLRRKMVRRKTRRTTRPY